MFLRNGGPNRFSQGQYASWTTDSGGSRRGLGSAVFVVLLIVLGLIYWLVSPQLVPKSVAYNTAEGLGFTHVKVIDREWAFIQFKGCDENDLVEFTVTGKNSAGKQQTFYVCAGIFKGGTARFP